MISLSLLETELAIEIQEASEFEAPDAEMDMWQLIYKSVQLLRTMKEEGLLTPRDSEIQVCFPGVY